MNGHSFAGKEISRNIKLATCLAKHLMFVVQESAECISTLIVFHVCSCMQLVIHLSNF